MPDRPREHPHAAAPSLAPSTAGPIAIVGAGRMGAALAAGLLAAGLDVRGPLRRGARAEDAAIVLLAVPDAEIDAAAALIAPGRTVGHLSGATTLAPLSPHEAFSIHPLMTVTGHDTSFAGVPAAVAGSTADSLAVAEALASALGLRILRVDEKDRPAYHAAASIAANYLVALEVFAEELAATAGVDRAALAPLVLTAARNWQSQGAAALTGPVARGDDETVARQRAAVAERLPERLALFDALAAATRDLAGRGPGPSGGARP
ncbi:DUF2520 domain-containing protein [Microbacterium yannicii]|uniref:DUF2520 domain-containing protein n=1 Tax=Microbacterium yannicii TaxID=671622 RepID=UPI0002E4DD84|nr:DUF2520 domain-containing protein [Microbacterium yannicii]